MAVAGNTAPALQIARIDGRYWITHRENRPTDILVGVGTAATMLLSGMSVWIASTDRPALEETMNTSIRAIQTRGGSAA